MMKEWKNPPPFRVALSCPLAATTFDTHYSVSFSFSDATLFTSHRVSNPQVSKSVPFSRAPVLKLLSARIIYFSLRGKSRAYTAYIVCVVYVICARLNSSSSRGRATTGPAARWAFVFLFIVIVVHLLLLLPSIYLFILLYLLFRHSPFSLSLSLPPDMASSYYTLCSLYTYVVQRSIERTMADGSLSRIPRTRRCLTLACELFPTV